MTKEKTVYIKVNLVMEVVAVLIGENGVCMLILLSTIT